MFQVVHGNHLWPSIGGPHSRVLHKSCVLVGNVDAFELIGMLGQEGAVTVGEEGHGQLCYLRHAEQGLCFGDGPDASIPTEVFLVWEGGREREGEGGGEGGGGR